MKKNPTSVILLGAAALTLLGSGTVQSQTYQQVWADEFNGSISSSWQFETGGGGWGNNEKQYYQRANATVTASELLITARKENVGGMPYTSARMKTQGLKEFTFGKIEARIKMPLGQGLWPAFWMLGANINTVSWPRCGELDIMEHVNADNKVYGTVHWDNNGHAEYGGSTITTPASYHVYSIEWTPTFIKWFVDGVQFHTIDITNGVGGTDEFQRPFFLLLNLAVAGNWPGQTVDETKLPATMAVDYVRVYQLTSAPAPAPTATLLQAEAFSSMSGVQVEACSDTGGGQDVGWIDARDWLAYNNVNFPTSGSYLVEYRVASPGGGSLSSDLNGGATQLGSLAVPATGGWQTWRTISQTVNVNAGTYNFGVFAQTGGWNLNWIRISKSGTSARGLAPAAGGPTLAGERGVGIYPNPVADRLKLAAGPELAGSAYQILDATGRVRSRGTISQDGLDVSALPAGSYTLRLSPKAGPTTSRRFSKQ
ncbi:carbohydrate-binding protein [uncultured Hymenobacter sp.]|uniref:carbohydrate-binding protein n=1 Tax=uncultured Hymenobacter sp. TaxID=170016 RepID=UPI0035CAD0A0